MIFLAGGAGQVLHKTDPEAAQGALAPIAGGETQKQALARLRGDSELAGMPLLVLGPPLRVRGDLCLDHGHSNSMRVCLGITGDHVVYRWGLDVLDDGLVVPTAWARPLFGEGPDSPNCPDFGAFRSNPPWGGPIAVMIGAGYASEERSEERCRQQFDRRGCETITKNSGFELLKCPGTNHGSCSSPGVSD